MNRPWLQLYTRDWLDDIALRSCSPISRSILADLMCLAHEGTPYGYLARDGQPLPEELMYGRMHVRRAMFRKAVDELEGNARLKRDDAGVLFIPRMVKDDETRRKRAAGGSLGGNPKLSTKVNLHSEKRISTHSRAGTHAGVPRSESDSESSAEGGGGLGEGFADWIEPIRAQQPNPSQFNVGIQLLTERSDCDEPAFRQEFASCHRQWSTHWKHNENGRYAPKFADFVLNFESYRKGPPAQQRQQTAFEKLQAASGGES